MDVVRPGAAASSLPYWLDPPPEQRLRDAVELLQELGALNDKVRGRGRAAREWRLGWWHGGGCSGGWAHGVTLDRQAAVAARAVKRREPVYQRRATGLHGDWVGGLIM